MRVWFAQQSTHIQGTPARFALADPSHTPSIFPYSTSQWTCSLLHFSSLSPLSIRCHIPVAPLELRHKLQGISLAQLLAQPAQRMLFAPIQHAHFRFHYLGMFSKNVREYPLSVRRQHHVNHPPPSPLHIFHASTPFPKSLGPVCCGRRTDGR